MSENSTKIISQDAYVESSRIYTYFIDWRNRMLIRYSLLSSAIVLLAKWISDADAERIGATMNKNFVIGLLMAAATGGAMITWLMDIRNRDLTRHAANVCKNIEKDSEVIGFYSEYEELRKNKITYHKLFTVLYLTAVILYASACIYFVFWKPLD